ncbi:MAG: MerC domain-containing protein [Pseudomonadota bacterium]
MSSRASTIDASAIGLSALCLGHCLALPVVGAFLPFAGVLAEAEWIHKVLVLTAVPITLFAIMRHKSVRVRSSFIAPALIGLFLLIAAGFIDALHDYEIWLTAIGAIFLGAAHFWHWVNRDASAA